jgi:hypothetical protein
MAQNILMILATGSTLRLARVDGPQPDMKMSARKLESYKRAEIVAQASRLMMTKPQSQKLTDLWSGAVIDWMAVTGKLKFDTPKRRGRSR